MKQIFFPANAMNRRIIAAASREALAFEMTRTRVFPDATSDLEVFLLLGVTGGTDKVVGGSL